MDRSYDKPLDVPALARVALTSEAHFIRTFKETFGETPHRYLQRRRLERAMALLRETERPVTEICLEVGFASLGSFSRTFTRVVGMSPSAYREGWRTGAGTAGYVPTCVSSPSARRGDGRRTRMRGIGLATPATVMSHEWSGSMQPAAACCALATRWTAPTTSRSTWRRSPASR